MKHDADGCLKTTTISADDLLGSIEAGKVADLVSEDGDPLKDLQVFGKVVFLMKDGVVYKHLL